MLLLARYPGEGIVVRLADDVDPEAPIGDVFAEPISIQVMEVSSGGQVRLGFTADRAFRIVREEIVDDVELGHSL